MKKPRWGKMKSKRIAKTRNVIHRARPPMTFKTYISLRNWVEAESCMPLTRIY